MQIATNTVPCTNTEIKLTPKQERNFWKKVDKSGGADACWLWTAGRSRGGYGQFKIESRDALAHRVAWTLANGQIPHDGSHHGICVCHDCPDGDNPSCCNPAHLFLGTNAENMRDRNIKGRQAKGETHGFRLHPARRPRGERVNTTKLTAEQVIEIRAIYAKGELSYAKISKLFGVHSSTIGHIIHLKIWTHI